MCTSSRICSKPAFDLLFVAYGIAQQFPSSRLVGLSRAVVTPWRPFNTARGRAFEHLLRYPLIAILDT